VAVGAGDVATGVVFAEVSEDSAAEEGLVGSEVEVDIVAAEASGPVVEVVMVAGIVNRNGKGLADMKCRVATLHFHAVSF
jgi:hypothetical protein